MEEHEKRIGNITGIIMVIVALFYDVIQIIITAICGFLPILIPFGIVTNWLISFWAYLHFSLWFRIKDLSLVGLKKKALGQIIPRIMEILPGSFLPGITIGTIITIMISRAEDKLLSKDQLAQLDHLLNQIKHGGLSINPRSFKTIQTVDNIRRVS